MDDDETTTSGKTVLGKRTRRTDACNTRGRKRRAGVDEGNEAARGRRSARNRIVTARQLERLRGGLGEPFGEWMNVAGLAGILRSCPLGA